MANDFHEIAMIGDRDSVLLAKAAGLAVFAETDGAAGGRRGAYTGLPRAA